DRRRRWDVVVNRTSPSSHRRGHGRVLFYAEPLLAHLEAIGVPVINPVAAWRFEKSKALQVQLFERLGVRYPRTVIANGAGPVRRASREIRFPALVKPNVGGSGALIERIETPAELDARADSLDFGPDGVALLQDDVNATSNFVADAPRVLGFDPFPAFADVIVRAAGRAARAAA